jgi:uncharacterized protein (DUF58 family)
MLVEFWISLVGLIFLAVFLGEDFVLKVIYLLLGAYLVGGWWSRKAFGNLRFTRRYNEHAFLNEEVLVTVEAANQGWLPVLWLKLHESIPVGLSSDKNVQKVVSLKPLGKVQFEYRLQAHRRGYYRVGPLFASSGDLFGLFKDQRWEDKGSYLTVYPQIVPLTKVNLPSLSPLGTLRHNQPIYEDPSRVQSKRDYIAGDSLRRVDWKSSAVVGRLQVKQFEPSIALETSVFLNLYASEYEQRYRIDTTELAIVVAASLSTWISAQKQPVGLITNGMDPTTELKQEISGQANINRIFPPVSPAKGSGNLMRILEILARVQAADTLTAVERLRLEHGKLSWGTTLILISGHLDDELFRELFQLRRYGLNICLVLVGRIRGFTHIQAKARYFHFPLYSILTLRDLDMWRL